MKRSAVAVSALAVMLAAAAHAAPPALALPGVVCAAAHTALDETLKVGDKAPELKVGKWVKGEPVTSFDKGGVYVVEFWATWCPPCRESIPHLTSLQKEYKDKNVRIIGVSVWERDQGAVEPFVTKMGDKMDYSIAYDDVAKGKKGNEGAMAKTWMEAAGQDGIPAAFIIKDGVIQWIGSPFSMDKPLEQIVAGKYDPKKEAQMAQARKDAASGMRKYQAALKGDKVEDAAKIGAELLPKLNDDAEMLNQLAWFMVDPEMGVTKPDLDLAFKAASRAVELTEGKDGMILDTLARVHFLKGDVAKAIEIQTKAVELSPAQIKDQIQATLDEYKKAQK